MPIWQGLEYGNDNQPGWLLRKEIRPKSTLELSSVNPPLLFTPLYYNYITENKKMKGELRIGNLVTDEFYEAFRKTIIVESVNDKGINLEIENSDDYPEMQSHWIEPYYTFDKLRGIPITTEWLEKFDWGVYKFLYFNSNFCLDDSRHLYYRNDYTGINIMYVHQLQNLYFALTGEELTLKEENRKHKE